MTGRCPKSYFFPKLNIPEQRAQRIQLNPNQLNQVSTYQGILIRNNLDDKGAIPRTGAWVGCPDIIPWGNVHENDAQTKFGTPTVLKLISWLLIHRF
jgi:hypothetical protein